MLYLQQLKKDKMKIKLYLRTKMTINPKLYLGS